MPYQKGQSGNPNGRPPKALALSDIICARVTQKGKDGKRHIDVIIDRAIVLARAGDPIARTWIADRGWGKALQPQEHTGAGGGPIDIRVTYADA